MSHSENGRTAKTASDFTPPPMDGVSRAVSDAAAGVGAAVRDAAQQAYASASEFRDETIAQGNRFSADVRGQVRHQPLTAVLAAAGIGLVAGLLLARR